MKYFVLHAKSSDEQKVIQTYWIKHPETPSEELLKKHIADDEEIYRLTEIDNPEQWFKTLNV
jgi:hypothetical protein